MILLALALAGLGAADQRALWWRFRDPAANEPSDSAYRSKRIVAFLCAAVMMGMVLWTFTW
ncbi:hypothetical protein [Streptomyces aurantiogriseus]|nr:hypothetical protein [Streptomyces aurantiogriseus]